MDKVTTWNCDSRRAQSPGHIGAADRKRCQIRGRCSAADSGVGGELVDRISDGDGHRGDDCVPRPIGGTAASPLPLRGSNCRRHEHRQTPVYIKRCEPRRCRTVIFHAASIRRFSRRRSSSPRPPQIPWRSLSARAIARHSTRTWQPPQIRFARVTRPPRCGKKSSGSASTHAARVVHGGGLMLWKYRLVAAVSVTTDRKSLQWLVRIDSDERLRESGGRF